MLTQCPHCLTLFRVGPEHLKAAAGQVRCCRCHQIFNALQSLRETPAPFVNGPAAMDSPAPPQTNGLESSTEPTAETHPEFAGDDEAEALPELPPEDDFRPLLPDLESPEPLDDLLDDILERDDGLDPEPDYLAAGSESQMSELLDQDSSSILLPEPEDTDEQSDAETAQSDDNIVAFSPSPALTPQDETATKDLPEEQGFEDSILKDEAIDEGLGRPDYDSVPALPPEEAPKPEAVSEDERALNFEAEAGPRPQSKQRLFWLVGSLLLLLPLAGQLAWQFRGSLIQNETGRQTLELVCSIAGCDVPERRDLNKVVIQGRNLSSHPEKRDTLLLQLSLVNTAAFAQPFPQLTLSLYNDKGNLIARRTFSKRNYLPTEYADQRLMPPAQPILVELELVDPGKEVTGFSFDFY